uniref:Polynucleotide adenylyltransferase n=1 Tax=Globodera pallida TaxID=36090 RepID=A0A183C3G4_GLOPA
MRKLFENWSDEARFQIPALIYLKPINEVFTPICMLPEGFDVPSKIFGNFQCKLSERMICSDNSLFCIFCKNANVNFLQKYPMDQQMLAVPKLKINFMRTNFESVAAKSAKKNDHLNENIASKVRAKSTMKRQRMEQINAILTVLWNHAIQLKVIELLLTRQEMFKMHRLDESVMNGRILSNFRTIHAYVELWAKDKNLLNGQFNSQMIILMLTKVLLLFPGETSVPFLLEKFFLIYSLWDWPKPLQLTEINYEKKGEFLLWSPAREWFQRQQEKGDREMQNEFANAFNQIRTAKDGAAFVLAKSKKEDE